MGNQSYEFLIDEWVDLEDKIIALTRLHQKLIRKRVMSEWALLAANVHDRIDAHQARQSAIEEELLTRWNFSKPG